MSSSAQYFLPAPPGGPGSTLTAPSRPRRWIDAQTRDYVVERGRLKQDDGFTSKVVLAWSTDIGTCQVDPTFGHRFREVRSVDERGRRLLEAYALLAIAHLSQEIKDLKVSVTIPKGSPGRFDMVASGRKGMQVVSAKYSRGL